jgi:hypothetical protein
MLWNTTPTSTTSWRFVLEINGRREGPVPAQPEFPQTFRSLQFDSVILP